MKNLFFSALIGVMALVSCSKDDENTSIVGTWIWESVVENGKEVPLSECEKKITMIFTEKEFKTIDYETGNGGVCEEMSPKKGSYKISGNKIILQSRDLEDREEYTFSIKGNTLILTVEEEQYENNQKVKVVIVTTLKRK